MHRDDRNFENPPASRSRLEGFRAVNKGRWFRLHPLSGIAILAIDNLFFGVKLATAGIAWPITMSFAFLLSFLAVWLIQRVWVGERGGKSFLKALVAGFIAGVPTSIGGTLLGAWVIARSGLSMRQLTKRPGADTGRKGEK